MRKARDSVPDPDGEKDFPRPSTQPVSSAKRFRPVSGMRVVRQRDAEGAWGSGASL
ncbi:MAG: hypothetical protein LBD42_00530 [Desulfovibrio sp.]|nr:hypothetical protein [Desulfovibrio sp.]